MHAPHLPASPLVLMLVAAVTAGTAVAVWLLCCQRARHQLRERIDAAREQARLTVLAQLGPGLVHDLLNVLVSIENAVQMVTAHPDREDLRQHLLTLVEADLVRGKCRLRELARIAKPRSPEDLFVPVDLCATAEKIVAQHREEVRAKVVLALPEPGLSVSGNPDDVARVIAHLLGNAVRATEERSGRIRISVERKNGRVVLSVADPGCGIPAERLAGLGRDFWAMRRNGVGLGLPLVRRIVEDMGGSLLIESTAGIGTTVTITLPEATEGRVS